MILNVERTGTTLVSATRAPPHVPGRSSPLMAAAWQSPPTRRKSRFCRYISYTTIASLSLGVELCESCYIHMCMLAGGAPPAPAPSPSLGSGCAWTSGDGVGEGADAHEQSVGDAPTAQACVQLVQQTQPGAIHGNDVRSVLILFIHKHSNSGSQIPEPLLMSCSLQNAL